MADSYVKRIHEYCDAAGVVVPSSFRRRAASRYAIVELDSDPPRLVAKTWFTQHDLLYYLAHLASGGRLRILDFKEKVELRYEGGLTLTPGDPF